AGDYLKPIDVLKNHLSESVKRLKEELGLTPDEVLSEAERKSIIECCDAIIGFCENRDILQVEGGTNFDTIIQDLREIEGSFSDTVEELTTAHADEDNLIQLYEQFNALSTQMQA